MGGWRTHFPLLQVNAALFLTLIPVSFVFHFESLTTEVKFRWNSHDIKFVSLKDEDYRQQIFVNSFNATSFGLWTFEVLVTLFVLAYHIVIPHHPKFYSTTKNSIFIIMHMIGGTVATLGFYVGVVSNLKGICFVAAIFGLFLHWPSAIWLTRQLHGKQEIMVPSYTIWVWLLLQGYVDFFLYDASYQTVFTCAMTMNTFAMVRLMGFLGRVANMEDCYNRATLLAGLCQAPFIGGSYTVLIFILAVLLWNIYFSIFKPFPRNMLRIDRGYNDTVPDMLEMKRGKKFADELQLHSETTTDKKEAIAKALFRVLAGDDNCIDIQEVIDLYHAWGMPDAEPAAYATFRRRDKDGSGAIDYNEFKVGFNMIIKGIYLKGEFESIQDSSRLLGVSKRTASSKIRVSPS